MIFTHRRNYAEIIFVYVILELFSVWGWIKGSESFTGAKVLCVFVGGIKIV